MASSSMVPRGNWEITITPTWDVSDDVELTGTKPHARTFSVPEFVATVYENIQTQIRTIATKLAGTDEMARISEADQAEMRKPIPTWNVTSSPSGTIAARESITSPHLMSDVMYGSRLAAIAMHLILKQGWSPTEKIERR